MHILFCISMMEKKSCSSGSRSRTHNSNTSRGSICSRPSKAKPKKQQHIDLYPYIKEAQ